MLVDDDNGHTKDYRVCWNKLHYLKSENTVVQAVSTSKMVNL